VYIPLAGSTTSSHVKDAKALLYKRFVLLNGAWVYNMGWLEWLLINASNNIYFMLPFAGCFYGLYLITKHLMLKRPNKDFGLLEGGFIIFGIVGFLFLDAYPRIIHAQTVAERQQIFPNEKSFKISASGSFNPITWLIGSAAHVHFISPTFFDPTQGRNAYKHQAIENTFMVNVLRFNSDENISEYSFYEYAVDCKDRVFSVSGPDKDGVMRWLESNQSLSDRQNFRFCESDYTTEFEKLKCMQNHLSVIDKVDNDAIRNAGQMCSRQ
jgi:hypothetical protein